MGVVINKSSYQSFSSVDLKVYLASYHEVTRANVLQCTYMREERNVGKAFVKVREKTIENSFWYLFTLFKIHRSILGTYGHSIRGLGISSRVMTKLSNNIAICRSIVGISKFFLAIENVMRFWRGKEKEEVCVLFDSRKHKSSIKAWYVEVGCTCRLVCTKVSISMSTL